MQKIAFNKFWGKLYFMAELLTEQNKDLMFEEKEQVTLKEDTADIPVASDFNAVEEEFFERKEEVKPETERVVVLRKGFRYFCYKAIKRAFDIFAGLLALIILSPFILLALLIKWLEDFHNPIYVSKRVGKNGKEFRFFKIRTMCVNAENMKDDLIKKGLNESDGPAFKIKDDPRITKIGKLYRKLSIDELPQLLNIINGTMSIVGPRPPIPCEVEKYTDEQKQRLLVRGGLLCTWQIQKNRNKLSFDEWVKLDLDYIEHQSLWLDLKIIFKGFFMVLFDRSGE